MCGSRGATSPACAPHRLAPLGIAYVPEDRRIFRLLTVLENLRTGLDRPGVTAERRQELLDKVYASFPVLRERRHQAGGTLSGGEQQMLAIARAMMLEPKIILLDEPTEGLMPRMVSQIREIIEVLHRDGVAILLVEQNVPADPRGLEPHLHHGEGRRPSSRASRGAASGPHRAFTSTWGSDRGHSLRSAPDPDRQRHRQRHDPGARRLRA